MKILHYSTGYITQRITCRDDTQADAAYAAIKKAMADYKEYGNDQDKAVSVKIGGGEITIRLKALMDVQVWPLDDAGIEVFAEEAAYFRRVKKAREALPSDELGAVAKGIARSA